MEENIRGFLKPEYFELENEGIIKVLVEELGKAIDPLVFAEKAYKKYNRFPARALRSKAIQKQEIKDLAQIFENLMKCSYCSRGKIEITTVCDHKFCSECFSEFLRKKQIKEEDPSGTSINEITYDKIIFKCPIDNCEETTEFSIFDLIEDPRNLNERNQKKYVDLFLGKINQ